MGNICGCVRGPKEECYVDPKNAPLRPESKELKGRRYFQRKKRKSEDIQPTQSLSPGSQSITREAICSTAESQHGPDGNTEESQTGMDKPLQVETHSSSQDSLSKGVYVGEVPVLIHRHPCDHPPVTRLACRSEGLSTEQTDVDRSSVGRKLCGINTTSRGGSTRESLLAKKLLQRQLRRAVSFGAVEHVLLTLRGNDRPESEETFAKIIWGSQACRRRRRRAFTCSGYIEHHFPSPAKCISTAHEVNPSHVIYSH